MTTDVHAVLGDLGNMAAEEGLQVYDCLHAFLDTYKVKLASMLKSEGDMIRAGLPGFPPYPWIVIDSGEYYGLSLALDQPPSVVNRSGFIELRYDHKVYELVYRKSLLRPPDYSTVRKPVIYKVAGVSSVDIIAQILSVDPAAPAWMAVDPMSPTDNPFPRWARAT